MEAKPWRRGVGRGEGEVRGLRWSGGDGTAEAELWRQSSRGIRAVILGPGRALSNGNRAVAAELWGQIHGDRCAEVESRSGGDVKAAPRLKS